MVSSSRIALLGAAAFLPSVAVAASTPFLDVCAVSHVLEYFACLSPLPEGCVESVEEQAVAFCSSYLSVEPVTTYLSTVTPEGEVVTVTETTTVSDTVTDVVVTTTETTATTTSTSTELETTTATVTAVITPVKRAPTITAILPTNCPDLTKKHLDGKPGWKLSKACSCLDPQPTTVTLDATTLTGDGETVTVTEPATATVVASETTLTTETSITVVTEATTVTETSTATATVQPPAVNPRCLRYRAAGNGLPGNTVRVATATSWEACCDICQNTSGCVAGAWAGGSYCQLLVRVQTLGGAPTNAQCPLGMENYNFGAPNPAGTVFAGPCGGEVLV